ncbi:MAG: hypothetical protein ACOYMN_20565 [Roseimicrobium sp.]
MPASMGKSFRPMTKFSSLLVSLMGIAMLIVLGVMMLQRFIPVNEVEPEPELVLPQSDLPPLMVESKEVLQGRLDTVFKEAGGVAGVTSYVEKEFVPGRVLIFASAHETEPERKFVILDREVRQCDTDGVVIVSQAPLVPRVAVNMQLGQGSAIHAWSRLRLATPFVVTAWCQELRK